MIYTSHVHHQEQKKPHICETVGIKSNKMDALVGNISITFCTGGRKNRLPAVHRYSREGEKSQMASFSGFAGTAAPKKKKKKPKLHHFRSDRSHSCRMATNRILIGFRTLCERDWKRSDPK